MLQRQDPWFLAILDSPSLTTTKVCPQVKYEKFWYSVYISFLNRQHSGLFHHLEKMKVKIQKATENFQYRPHWIRHIRPQQKSVLKRTMKGFCIASIFCFCKGRILSCSTNLKNNEAKNKKNDNLKYRQYWISHIWIQQRSVLKWSTKSFCIASIFCFCRSRNLVCSTI